MAWHLVLPIFVSVLLSIGGLMRYTRTNTLEVLSADYIRTARAKGLSEKELSINMLLEIHLFHLLHSSQESYHHYLVV